MIPCAHLIQNPTGISIGLAVSVQMTACCPYTLQWDAPPPKNCPFPSGSGPTRVLNPNGISIGAAVFAGLTSVTDRQTERQTDRQTTLLGRNNIGRIYVRSTAMQPKNNSIKLRNIKGTQVTLIQGW